MAMKKVRYRLPNVQSDCDFAPKWDGRSNGWISEFCHVFHDDFLYAVFCLCGAVCDWLCVRLYQTTLNKYHDKWLNN
ncbi:hypothetical protein GFCGCJNF_00301 [Mannheimia haemolytica]